MTPGERVVVQAALNYVKARAVMAGDPHGITLEAAVGALLAERDASRGIQEVELTWGQVVVSDQIYNDKVSRWYEVSGTVHMPGGQIKIGIKGIPKSILRDSYAPVLVRRSAMGEAADMFASVLWSGQSAPEPRAVEDVALPEAEES